MPLLKKGSGDGDLHGVLSDAATVAVIQGLGLAVGYVAQLLFARWLGRFEYGLYSFSWSALVLVATLAGFGYPLLGVRETSAAMASGQNGRVLGFVRFSARRVGIVALLATVVSVVALLIAGNDVAEDYRLPLLYAASSIVPLALIILFGELARGMGRPALAYAPRVLMVPLGVVLLTIALRAAGVVLTASRLVLLLAGVTLLIALAQGWRIRICAREVADGAPPQSDAVAWRQAARPMYLGVLFGTTMNQFDSVLIGVLSSPDAVAVYFVAKRTALLVATFLTAMNAMVAPRISRIYQTGTRDELQQMIRRVLPFVLIPGTAAVLVLAAGHAPLLRFLGSDYAGAKWPLLMLLGSYFVNVAVGPSAFLLTMTGHQWVHARIMGLSAATMVLGMLALVPTWGAVAAAGVFAVVTVMWNVATWLTAWRITGIDTSFVCLLRR